MLSRYKKLFLSLFFLSLYAGIVVFATPPGSQYTPGETLDPSCAPGSANCSVLITGGGSGWSLTGNAGTNPATNFIGTTDDVDFVIRRNNVQVARFYSDNLFLGASAGINSSGVTSVNFIGENAGNGATSTHGAIFIGENAGYLSNNTDRSIFIGENAGGPYQIDVEDPSDFITITDTTSIIVNGGSTHSAIYISSSGDYVDTMTFAGDISEDFSLGVINELDLDNIFYVPFSYYTNPEITDIFYDDIEDETTISFSNLKVTYNAIIQEYVGISSPLSNFIGSWAGSGSTNVTESNFLGVGTGFLSSGSYYSNFIGSRTGSYAPDAFFSNFIGKDAGNYAERSNNSNFIGEFAGYGASDVTESNFLGRNAGNGAIGSSNSNFIGSGAGNGTTYSINSNFIGTNAGRQSTSISYSNLFGFGVGRTFGINNIGSNNIIIGTNISLPDATANAINIGGVLFGTGTYATTTGNPSITPVSGGRIGIGVVSPSYTLQVGNSGVSGIVARFQNSTGTCDINPTTTSLVCSSDETLKSNITTLPSSLSLLTELRPVTYTWNASTTSTSSVQEGSGQASQTQVGFIAQEVESILPSLVFTDPLTGLKSLAYTNLIPYTISALQELNFKIEPYIFEEQSFRERLTTFLRGVAEKGEGLFDSLFAREATVETLCVGTKENKTCISKEELDILLIEKNIHAPAPEVNTEEAVIEDETSVDEGTLVQEEEIEPPAIETETESETKPSEE